MSDIATTRASLDGWIVKPDFKPSFENLLLTLTLGQSNYLNLAEGSAVLLLGKDDTILGIGRVFSIRTELYKAHIYFGGFEAPKIKKTLSDFGLKNLDTNTLYSRIEWDVFSKLCTTLLDHEFEAIPFLEGKSINEQAYVRELLKLATQDDLLGPANGPFEEIIGMSVRDRYLVGKLAPRETLEGAEQNEALAASSGRTDADSANTEVETSSNRSLVPSSIGFTFCIDGNLKELKVEARWGRYEKADPEVEIEMDEEGKRKPKKKIWKRTPAGGHFNLKITEGEIEPIALDLDTPNIIIKGTIRIPQNNSDRLITLFLINNQELPETNQDEAWVFQPEIIVRDVNGGSVFRRKSVLNADGADIERESLEMIYRERVEFAVGHGTSVHAITDSENPERARELKTIVIPEYEVPVTETPGLNLEDRVVQQRMVKEGLLDMKNLATFETQKLIEVLTLLTTDYESWIKEQSKRIKTELANYEERANEALDSCSQVLDRLKDGINALATDTKALEAFRFANNAMSLQRVKSIQALAQRRGEAVTFESLNVPKNRSWRPFQLAFVLMSIPSLTDPEHVDRRGEADHSFADLLWFPTGGGKTEAYLGVAAFAMSVRRLQGNLGGLDSSRGLSVIMRYTLRLLTLQQFQRASALICAMEVIRRENPTKWGNNTFTIGLWVGQKSTPNSTEESAHAIQSARDGKHGGASTPAQLTSCPWCGTEIIPGRDIDVRKNIGRTIIYCGDKYHSCEFSKGKSEGSGLPIVVVDEEIYRRPPSMLIATVDKFAMMAWKGQTRNLFGKANTECDRHGLLWPESPCTGRHTKLRDLPASSAKTISPIRPPDLIIQDEFHLISGPLGTMVGLYETAVDELSSWSLNGKTVKPKIIASTATVRKAPEQVNNVFLRKVLVFPPHGLDVEDNFFSVQRPIAQKPGRRYIGICAPGSSRPAVLIRLYVALLTASQKLFDTFGTVADPYMTLVGYFNSLRELGGMKRLSEDDVQTRSYRVLMGDVSRPGLAQRSVKNIDELTSRVTSKDIPKKLDLLEVKFKKVWQKGESRAIDVVLATNMLSVGVDINRLGLMVVNGQPKSTAEYIQATSRVGRSFPGLVCTVLTWSRPRDLSHYESFEHYHATFYKHVEAQSVTPFAPRALDRGLTGAMVSALRLSDDGFNPNLGAESMNAINLAEVAAIKKAFTTRAWLVTNRKQMGQYTEDMISDRIDRWVREATQAGRRLAYDTYGAPDNAVALLKKPGLPNWNIFTAPTSMREVEPGVRLIMDDAKISSMPDWKIKTKNDNNESGGEE
ncbi:MAG TPA: DISARM system helicase DrmA [Bacteriovoracaceae bacterium]|nr:DISARM system helicase DrmA [Bacteriovoracaceae bacterium]